MRESDSNLGQDDLSEGKNACLRPGMPVEVGYNQLKEGQSLQLLDMAENPVAAFKKNLEGNTDEEKSYTLTLHNGDEYLLPVPYFGRLLDFEFIIDVHGNLYIQHQIPAKENYLCRLDGVQPRSKTDVTFVEEGMHGAFNPDAPIIHSSFLNGGNDEIALANCRRIGRVKNFLERITEDTVAFCDDTVVVADGLGGHFHGKLASDFAARTLLEQVKIRGNFRDAVLATRLIMDNWLVTYKAEVERVKKVKKEQPSWVYHKKFDVPDAVMAAVHFDGNRMETMVLGDSAILVVRGKEIVYRSREHTYVNQWVKEGKMTKRQALESPQRTRVSSTIMMQDFNPDFDEFLLQPGDTVILVTDGLILPEDIIIKAAHAPEPKVVVNRFLRAKYRENFMGGGEYDPGDGGPPILVPSLDNGGIAAIRYKGARQA